MKYLLQRIPRAVAGILLVGLAGTFAGCGSDLLGTEDDDKPVVLSIDGARQVSAFYGEQKTTAFTLSLKGDDWSDALTSATADASAEQPADISDYFDVFLYDANDTNITARTLSNWQVCATGAVERTDFSGQTSYSEGIVARLSITLQLTFNNVSADDVTGTIKLYAKPATTRGGSYQMTTNQFPCIVEGKSWGIKKPTYDAMAAAGAGKNVTLLTFESPLSETVEKDSVVAIMTIDGAPYNCAAVQTTESGAMSVPVSIDYSNKLAGIDKDVKITYTTLDNVAVTENLNGKVCYVYYGQNYADGTIDWVSNGTDRYIVTNDDECIVVNAVGNGHNGTVVYSKDALPSDLPPNFTLSFDLKLQGGNDQTSAWAINSAAGKDTQINANKAFDAENFKDENLFFVLDQTEPNATTWTINRGSQQLNIEKGLLYNYTIESSTSSLHLKVETSGDAIFDEDISVLGTGLGIMQFLTKRYYAEMAIDNIAVYQSR